MTVDTDGRPTFELIVVFTYYKWIIEALMSCLYDPKYHLCPPKWSPRLKEIICYRGYHEGSTRFIWFIAMNDTPSSNLNHSFFHSFELASSCRLKHQTEAQSHVWYRWERTALVVVGRWRWLTEGDSLAFIHESQLGEVLVLCLAIFFSRIIWCVSDSDGLRGVAIDDPSKQRRRRPRRWYFSWILLNNGLFRCMPKRCVVFVLMWRPFQN